MSGIQFLVDETGHRTAVMIDLKRNKALWEDFYDTMVAKKRRNEPRESLATVRQKLIKAGKLNG
jgi:hypothetical protein